MKKEFHSQKGKFYHLLTLKLFQTCMNFFLLLKTKEDILMKVRNKTVVGPH